jgi:hypothetical protein
MHDPMVFILDESLEAIEKGIWTRTQCLERYPEHRKELAMLLDAALILRSSKIPAPSTTYFKANKTRLIAQIKHEQQLTVFDRWSNFVRVLTPNSLKRQAVSLVVLVTLLFGMLGGGTLYASAHALPGDNLYPVKTVVENLRLAVSGQESDADLYIQFADLRMKEIEALMEAGREQDLPAALQRFEENLVGARVLLENQKPGDETWAKQKADKFESQLNRHLGVLEQVLDNAPTPAKPAISHAITVSKMNRNRLIEHWRGDNPPGPSEQAVDPTDTPSNKPVGAGKPTDLPSGRPDVTGKPDDTPGGKPDEPGKPDDTPGGKPDDPGKPDDTPGGKPDDPGKPDDTPGGKPEDPGKPEDTPGGKPENTGKPEDTPGGKPDSTDKDKDEE